MPENIGSFYAWSYIKEAETWQNLKFSDCKDILSEETMNASSQTDEPAFGQDEITKCIDP